MTAAVMSGCAAPKLLRRAAMLLLLLLAAMLAGGRALAADGASNRSAWQGTIGLGPIFVPKYVGSERTTVMPIPLVSLSYREVLFFDFDHGGVNLWGSDDRSVSLSFVAFPRWGHSGSSGPRLADMARRRDSIEAGPVLNWQTPLAEFNLGYARDLLGASRGGVLRLGASREIVARDGFSLDLDLNVERLSARVTDYYFGVRPAEATPTRPAYQGSAGTEFDLGISGSYDLSASNAFVFGAGMTRLNRSAAASPIVETRRAGVLWFGYAWKL